MQWPTAVGIDGRVRRLPAATRRAASSGVRPSGRRWLDRLRSGTDRIVPWLVRVLAVATVSELHAAAVSRSSHSGPTTTSLLRTTTSRPGVAANPALQARTNPRFSGCCSTTTGWAIRLPSRSSRWTIRRSTPQSSTSSSAVCSGVWRVTASMQRTTSS